MLTVVVDASSANEVEEPIVCMDIDEAIDMLIAELRDTSFELSAPLPSLHTVQRDAEFALNAGKNYWVELAGLTHSVLHV